MSIRKVTIALGTVRNGMKVMLGHLARYVEFGVDVTQYSDDFVILDRIHSKVESEIQQGPEKVNPKWIGSVVELAEARVTAAIRLEKGFLLSPYVRSIMMNRIYEIEKTLPEVHDRLMAELEKFDGARAMEKSINSTLRESFNSLVAIIEDCEREATIKIVDQSFKPAPPAPVKRNRKAARSEADRARRNAMKGKGGQKPARGKQAA